MNIGRMFSKCCKIAVLLLCVCGVAMPMFAQKLITYEAGMGSRDASNPDVWILYQKVRAKHEGMTLYADSALLDTKRNDFTAFRNIHIVLSDTTHLWGDQLYYDGNYRVVNIWGDTVLLRDGKTELRSDNIEFDRNINKAIYSHWGRGNNRGDSLESNVGVYDATDKVFYIMGDVVMHNKDSRVFTDTLVYYTREEMVQFISATEIFHDTSYLYSESGRYYTKSGLAQSEKASYLEDGPRTLTCDTLYFNDKTHFAQAFGNVFVTDTVNNVFCNGRYGETDQSKHYTFVTDSALVRYVQDGGDTLFLHADTIFVVNDTAQELDYIKAFWGVRMFRNDGQGVCDSLIYTAKDSTITMYENPVMWYESYQCSADTIVVTHDSSGVKLAFLEGGCFAIEKVDSLKFNQVKGKRSVVYFKEGEPDFADIIGNAQMVFYITEDGEDGSPELIGVNVGMGSDMRIYMENRQAKRVVTMGDPDMHTYPLQLLPAEKSRLKDFKWQEEMRPKNRHDVFRRVNMAENDSLANKSQGKE